MRHDQIIAHNRYDLTGTAADFRDAACALAARVEAEGHPGVLSYRFFTGAGAAWASVIYADAGAWIGHHAIVMPWPEMAALRAAGRLTSVTLLGPVTDGMRDWLRAAGLAAVVTEGGPLAAGFVRG